MEADCLKRLCIKHGLEKDPDAPEDEEVEEDSKKKSQPYDDSDNEFACFD